MLSEMRETQPTLAPSPGIEQATPESTNENQTLAIFTLHTNHHMNSYLRSLASDIFDLVYPRICAACMHGKPVRGGIFCMSCLTDLPETGFHLVSDNAFERHFWGRINVEAGAAFFFFIPQGKTQELLHNIKYRGRSDFAEAVGQQYGHELQSSDRFNQIDCIIPVPLHPGRLRKRGFNQSAAFGKGLAEVMGIPLLTNVLIRRRATSTQTRKSRTERIKNMEDAFVIKHPGDLNGKHVMIVDDVLTTGATLEACAIALSGAADLKVSLVTMACGRL